MQTGDVQVPVGPVSYENGGGAGPFIAELTLNNGSMLGYGDFRLFICGSTSITDLAGNRLNNGIDRAISFTLVSLPVELPATGFAPGRITILPPQTLEKSYNSTDLLLSIPALGKSLPIVGVPITDMDWDTTWLYNNVGYLEGGAFPTRAGNTVLTGHVWDAYNQPGPFFGLKQLRFGDLIQIQTWGKVFSYQVQSNQLVHVKDVDAVMRPETQDWVTLLTCETFLPDSGEYLSRRMVRAVLVSVK